MRRLGNESQGIEEFLDDDGGAVSNDHPHVRGFLPGDHPHPQLYHSVTPIWHGGDSPEDLEDRFGEAYTCGFSTGFERGIAMAVTRPAGSAQFGCCRQRDRAETGALNAEAISFVTGAAVV